MQDSNIKQLWIQWTTEQKIAVLQLIRSTMKDKRLCQKSNQGDYWGFYRDEGDEGKANNNALVENVLKALFPNAFHELDVVVTAHEGAILTITAIYSIGYAGDHHIMHFSYEENDNGYARPSYEMLIDFINAFIAKVNL